MIAGHYNNNYNNNNYSSNNNNNYYYYYYGATSGKCFLIFMFLFRILRDNVFGKRERERGNVNCVS